MKIRYNLRCMCRFMVATNDLFFQHVFDGLMQAANYLTLLSAEDILRQRGQGLSGEEFRVPKQTMWVTIKKYKTHGTVSRLPGSGS